MSVISESALQSKCVKWLWNSHPETRGLFFEINNNPLNAVDGANRRAMGMVKGVADTCFLWEGKAHFIEFKDEKGRQSKDQIHWETVVSFAGFHYFIVRCEGDFRTIIEMIMI